jgi:hypothetical protein
MTTDNYANRLPSYPDVGTKFGAWTFVKPAEGYRWWVSCICGVVRDVRSQDLKQGASKSCGCLSNKGDRVRKNFRHGADYGSKVYRTWRNAKNRCFNVWADKYDSYGAAGLTMCNEWADSFEAFAVAVGEPPTAKHSLDRIDNSRGYEPGNVRWATATEQARNRNNTIKLTYKEQTKSVAEWAELYSIKRITLLHRLKSGWDIEKALTHPVRIC